MKPKVKQDRRPAAGPFFHSKSFVESSAVGKGTRVWAFTHVMKGATIGENCNIGEHCFIEENSRIGNRVTIKNGVSIWDGVTIEEDVFVGPNAVFTNDLFPISRMRPVFIKTLIKQGACIGANATILCGITVGQYSFVGAGAVVTKDAPDYSLAHGNPAKTQGWMCQCRKKLKFNKAKASCSCGLRFVERSGKVKLLSR